MLADQLLTWHLGRHLAAAHQLRWAEPHAPGEVPPALGVARAWTHHTALWERALREVPEPEELPLAVARAAAQGPQASPLTLHLRAAGTIHGAVDQMVNHWAAVTDAFCWTWHPGDDGGVLLAAPPADTSRGGRALTSFLVLEAVLSGRRATGGAWRPREVAVPWSAGPAWSKVLGGEVVRAAPWLRIAFRPGDMALQPTASDPSVARWMAGELKRFAAPRELAWGERVRRDVALQLADGPSLQRTARHLGRSPRSLHRDLLAEGTSFRSVVEAVRAEHAVAWLPELGLDEVAHRLGYSEARSFRRAFRRWTGQSPSAWLRGRCPEP